MFIINKLSIILPIYNESNTIIKTLDHIYNLCLDYQFEIIIVEDCSTDDSLIKAISYKRENRLKNKRIQILINKTNMGPSYCLHKGIIASRGNIILTLGADTILSKTYIKDLLFHYQDNNVIAVGSRIKSDDNDKNLYTYLGEKLDDLLRIEKYIPGLGMSFRKSLIKSINIFNGKTYWCEDFDFNIQLQRYLKNKINKKVLIDENLIIYTRYPKNISEIVRRHYRWGIGRGYLSKKFGINNITGNIYRFIYILSIIIFPFISTILIILKIFSIFILFSLLFIITLISPLFSLSKRYLIKKKEIPLIYKEMVFIYILAYLRIMSSTVGMLFYYVKLTIQKN